MTERTIGAISKATGLSIDTLRYYDKIQLVTPASRGANGRRYYSDADCEQLRFVCRAKSSGYSLEEIAKLVRFRRSPAENRTDVRDLAASKLEDVESRLKDLTQLRNELRLLLNLCSQAQAGCPILEHLDDGNAGT